MVEQTIWLSPRATAFTVVCEACTEEAAGSSERWLASKVEGHLRLEDGRGWARCSRGHEVRVERANHAPIGAF
jgi:hypothetical protein